MAKKVALVSCVSQKQPIEAPACELYCSAWFIKASAYAEQKADCWFILSAKYGLIPPTRIIKPYNMTLKAMSSVQKRGWAGRVFNLLVQILKPSDEVIFLARKVYRENLTEPILRIGCNISIPMEGLAISQQLSWLNHHGG